MIIWISRRILLPSSDWLITGRRLTTTAFSSEKGRRKGISTSHGYNIYIAYSRVHKEDGFKARRAYLWGWSLSAEFHVTNNETPFLQTQPCATDKRLTLTVFFLGYEDSTYTQWWNILQICSTGMVVLRKANLRPVVLKIISLIERWRIANTRWLVALCKQRRGMPNQLILKDLIWDRSDWT